MVVEFGFCIESREEEDMPETITGCMIMNKIQVDKAVSFDPPVPTPVPTPVTTPAAEPTVDAEKS
jgi:hypothetical protein